MPASRTPRAPRMGTRTTCALMSAIAAQLAAVIPCSPAKAGDSPVEEIYVLRSLRDTRVAPGDFCSKLEAPTSEDNYSFYAPAISSENGRISDAKAKSVGGIHGCFGKTSDAAVFKFYGEFDTNGIKGKAMGDCRAGKPDFPEAGLKLFACYFELSDLPAPYVGGQLSTNSVNSKNITGEASEPPGYTQVSIATIRLWKKR